MDAPDLVETEVALDVLGKLDSIAWFSRVCAREGRAASVGGFEHDEEGRGTDRP